MGFIYPAREFPLLSRDELPSVAEGAGWWSLSVMIHTCVQGGCRGGYVRTLVLAYVNAWKLRLRVKLGRIIANLRALD
jgi:hypothetical protein